VHIRKGSDFCLEQNIDEICLLKIDTEGYELQVLNGFKSMFIKNKIKMVYCEIGLNYSDTRHIYLNEINDFMSKNDFYLFGLYGVANGGIKSGEHFGNALYINRKYLEEIDF
jgi:hypothetical protein